MATITSICFAMTLLFVANEAAPNQKFNLKIPDECRGKGFCSIKPEGYDEMQDMIDQLLTPTFIADNLGDRIAEPVNTEELSPREDWHNCPYRKKLTWPTFYNGSNDSDADIIIQSKFFRQPIEEITCAKEKISTEDSSVECFQDLDLRSFNMKSTCVTLETTRTLLVYDPETRKPVKKPYPVPCCCTCNIERADRF